MGGLEAGGLARETMMPTFSLPAARVIMRCRCRHVTQKGFAAPPKGLRKRAATKRVIPALPLRRYRNAAKVSVLPRLDLPQKVRRYVETLR